MAKIPDAQTLGSRPISSSSGGRVVSFDGGSAMANAAAYAGKQMQQFGAQIGAKADEQRAAQDKLESAQAMLEYRKELDGYMRKAQESPDSYLEYEAGFTQTKADALERARARLSNSELHGMFDVAAEEAAMPYIGKLQELSDSVFVDKTLSYAADVSEQEKLLQMQNPDPKRLAQTQLLIRNSISPLVARGKIDQLKADSAIRQIDADNQKSYWNARINNGEGMEVYEELNNKQAAIDVIMKNELHADGVVRVHSDGDGRAVGGINSDSFPEQFAEVSDILRTQGQVAAKDYIRNFYQKEIIEKNGIDKLPVGVQDVVADGVTNHRGEIQKQLINAAKNGASRAELLDIRQNEYNRLAATGKKKYVDAKAGWDKRIRGLRNGGLEFTPDPDVSMQVMNQAKSYAMVSAREEMAALEKASALVTIVPKENINTLKDKLFKLNMMDDYRKVDEFGKTQDMVSDFIPMSITEQQDSIKADMEAVQSGKIDRAPFLDAKQKVFAKKISAIKDDAWGYLEANNIVQLSGGSLIGADQSSLDKVIKERRVQAQKAAPVIGGISLPLMTNSEIEQIKQARASGKNVAETLSMIGARMNGDEKRVAARALSEKDSTLGAMMSVDPITASRIDVGGKGNGFVSKENFTKMSASKLAGILINPESQENTINALYDYYKARAAENGNTTEAVDMSLVDESIKNVMGEISGVSINGNPSKVILPKGMTPYEFEWTLESMTKDDLIKMGGGANNVFDDFVSPKNLLAGNSLITAGDGIFNLMNTQTRQFVLDRSGNRFVLDVSKIAKQNAPKNSDSNIRNSNRGTR